MRNFFAEYKKGEQIEGEETLSLNISDSEKGKYRNEDVFAGDRRPLCIHKINSELNDSNLYTFAVLFGILIAMRIDFLIFFQKKIYAE